MKNPGYLTLRLPPVIGFALMAAARASNVSISGFVRSALIEKLPDAAVLPSLPPSPPAAPRRPLIIPAADMAAIARFGGHLGRLTGATVQLSKTCRENSLLPEHEALEFHIRELRAAKAEVVGVIQRLRSAEAITR